MLHVGSGVTTVVGDSSLFNPKPSTARGARRHAARNEQKKAHAEKAWGMAKSPRPRNYRPKPDKRASGTASQSGWTQR